MALKFKDRLTYKFYMYFNSFNQSKNHPLYKNETKESVWNSFIFLNISFHHKRFYDNAINHQNLLISNYQLINKIF